MKVDIKGVEGWKTQVTIISIIPIGNKYRVIYFLSSIYPEEMVIKSLKDIRRG